jgi:hypothetical protein
MIVVLGKGKEKISTDLHKVIVEGGGGTVWFHFVTRYSHRVSDSELLHL